MGVVASARDRHIGHSCVDKIAVCVFSVDMNKNTIGSKSLAAMTGYSVAVIEMPLLGGRKLNPFT